MALRVQSSFSAGELDPALHERTTLDKFRSALATARNVIVGKTGRILSAPGRKWFVETKTANKRVIIHTISEMGLFIEWGDLYLRVYNLNTGTIVGELDHNFTEADLDNISFLNISANSSSFTSTTMIFLSGEYSYVLEINVTLSTLSLYSSVGYFGLLNGPTTLGADVVATGSAGYQVAYAITRVINGQESAAFYPNEYVNLPLAAGQFNTIIVDADSNSTTDIVTELRVYRKPYTGAADNVPQAYGFIGLGDLYTATGYGKFIDYGGAADYTNSPPIEDVVLSSRHPSGAADFKSKTGTLYQQKLILSADDRIEASRTGFPTNFTRDYPLDSDSALSIRPSGQSLRVIFVIESDGIVVFTSQGVFVHFGELTPTNLSLFKKGNWIIDESVPPIAIPGAVLFVDSTTNTVRQFLQSEASVYVAEELSIFSNHLFAGNKVRSWAFQDGDFPILNVTFTDGTMAMFTYERSHEMRAWTRADFPNDVEWVATSTNGLASDTITQVQTILCPDDVSSSLDLRGVKLTGSFGTIGFWIDVDDNGGAIPGWASACTYSFEVTTIVGDMFGYQVAIELAAALATYNTYFSVSVSGATITVYGGTAIATSGGGSDFTITLVTAYSAPVAEIKVLPQTIFVTKNTDGSRHIELGVPRYVSATIAEADPESDMNESMAAMTAMVSWSDLLNDSLNAFQTFTFTQRTTDIITTDPITPAWDNQLNLDCGSSGIFTTGAGNPGNVGTILRHFDADGSSTDLEVIARTNDNIIIVMPASEFPSDYATTARLYLTKAVFSGLDHLEGENVAVISDGYLLASPNNDLVSYPVVTVTGGQITLPNSMTGAIVHIGRPYVMDVETLDIDTVEQRPVLIESMTVNKLYIKVLNSFGFYVGSRFPPLDSVAGLGGMESVFDSIEVDYEDTTEVIANRYDPPKSGRAELTLRGDWRSRGRICLRQVDPLHFEILSIIPDLIDLKRSDRGEE